jgi:uncharacterized membrane protein YjjP (DUF1212 family)
MPVLDLAMSVGERLLVSGMSANDVVVQMLRVTRAYGLSSVHVDLTYTSIGVTHHRGPTRRPLSMVRIVQPVVVDYSKAREISQLLTRIEDGLGIDEARDAYDEIFWAPPPYSPWIALLGSGGIAAGVSLTFSTSLLLALIAFVTASIAERCLRWLHARRVPPFFGQAAVAGGMTMVAAGVHELGRAGVAPFDDMDPTLIVVGGIVMLLAGVMIVGAVQDAIDQFYVTASARLLEVVMRTGGIVAGILVAIRVLEIWDVSFVVVNNPGSLAPLWAQFIGAGLISLSFAVYCFADVTTVALTALVGLVGYGAYAALEDAGSTEVVSNTTAALAVGALATLLVRGTDAPGFGMESGALLPLVPGLALLNGLLDMMGREPGNPTIVAGGRSLFLALLVALGIAAGATLGTYLGRPVNDQLRRLRRRAKTVAGTPYKPLV